MVDIIDCAERTRLLRQVMGVRCGPVFVTMDEVLPRGSPEPPAAEEKPPASSSSSDDGRRCEYARCPNPESSSGAWRRATRHTRAGDQDWTALIGVMLCHACWTQFRVEGTLQRKQPPRRRRGAVVKRKLRF